MVKKKQKYYTIWRGHKTGVFENWTECQLHIKNYPGAQYKSFPTKDLAETAYKGLYEDYVTPSNESNTAVKKSSFQYDNPPNLMSIAVDAASSGNPGTMEYRGVDTQTKKQLFYKGPFKMGTNNIGEFLAIVHGLAFLKKQQSNRILYTDSKTAISWVKKKSCNTQLKPTAENKLLFELIERAETWLRINTYSTPIKKWNTKAWGEIPADFGRK
ncbi:MAG: viroplasmin family protein [Flavobacteriaceae bacterium]